MKFSYSYINILYPLLYLLITTHINKYLPILNIIPYMKI